MLLKGGLVFTSPPGYIKKTKTPNHDILSSGKE
jgi:hypothetical protein